MGSTVRLGNCDLATGITIVRVDGMDLSVKCPQCGGSKIHVDEFVWPIPAGHSTKCTCRNCGTIVYDLRQVITTRESNDATPTD